MKTHYLNIKFNSYGAGFELWIFEMTIDIYLLNYAHNVIIYLSSLNGYVHIFHDTNFLVNMCYESWKILISYFF